MAALAEQWTPDELVEVWQEPAFNDLSFEKRSAIVEDMISGVARWSREQPGFDREAYQAVGDLIDKARSKLAGTKTVGEKAEGVLGTIGETFKSTAAVIGATAADLGITEPDASLKFPLENTARSLAVGLERLESAGVEKIEQLTGTGRQLETSLDGVRKDLLEGNFPMDDPQATRAWLKQRGDKLDSLAFDYHRTMADAAGWWSMGEDKDDTAIRAHIASKSLLNNPDNLSLVRRFAETRDPALWEVLRKRVLETPRREELKADEQKLRESQFADFLADVGGEGAREVAVQMGDPLDNAIVGAIPIAKGAKAVQEVSKLGRMGRGASELLKGAAIETASELGSQFAEDPNATAGERLQRAQDAFIGSLGLLGAGAGVKGAQLGIERLRGLDSAPEPASPPDAGTFGAAAPLTPVPPPEPITAVATPDDAGIQEATPSDTDRARAAALNAAPDPGTAAAVGRLFDSAGEIPTPPVETAVPSAGEQVGPATEEAAPADDLRQTVQPPTQPPESRPAAPTTSTETPETSPAAIAAPLEPVPSVSQPEPTTEELPPPSPPTAEAAPPTTPPQSPTGIRNAIVDQERVDRGLPERMAPLRRAFGQLWNEAMARIDADPQAGTKLVDAITANPRPLEDWESALLAHEQVTRQNAFDGAVDDVNSAATEADKMDAETRLARARDDVQTIYDAGQRVGTASGQSLAARKLLLHDNYTLARMEAVTRAVVNNGKPLSAEQAAEVKALHERIAAAEAKIADFEAKEQAAAATATFDSLIREMGKEARAGAKAGKRLTDFLDDQAAKARARIIARRGRLNVTVDPLNVAGLVDEAIIGAAHIGNGVTKFADWSKKMVDQFGERIRPYLTELFDRATGYHAANARLFSRAEQVPEHPTRENILESARPGEPLDPRRVFDLARAHVRNGVEGMEAVVAAVHKDLLPIHEGLTLRDVRDAFSGYGKAQFPSKEEDLTKLREYKNLARLTSQLEDALGAIPPLKTGPQRDKATAAVRELQKRVNDAMRRMGIVRTTPEQQLKTSLDAVKTRLRNEIEELDKAISTREPRPFNKSVIEYDAEAKALREQRDKKQEQYQEIFGKPEMSPEDRVKAALKSVDKSIAEEEQMLREGVLKRPPRTSKTPFSQEVEDRRMYLQALRDLRRELAAAENPSRTPEEIALARDKKAISTRIANLETKIAAGDYTPPPKRSPAMDREKTELLFKYARAKEAYTRGLFQAQLAKRSTPKKIWSGAVEVLNTARAIMTSLDFSAVFRQGGFIVFGHPVRALRSFPAMFRAFGSEKGQFLIAEEIRRRPNAPLYHQSKLYLADEGEMTLSKMEEAFMSRWAGKIPLVAGSQRAFTTFLNKLRADSFDAMAATLGRKGTVTAEEAKAIANFVNVATGRGSLDGAARAAVGLNTLFFAPRYVVSRFQMLLGQPLYRGNARTRGLIAAEYARALIGAGVVYALGIAFQDEDDAKIETDPRSSDFLKIRFGDSRIDPLFGLVQTTVLLSRLATGKTKNQRGKIEAIRGTEVPFGKPNSAEVIARFLRTKLSPAFGTAVNLLSGENVIGEPVTPATAARDLVTPISFDEIYEAMKERAVPAGTALGLLSIFGMGLQTYHATESETAKTSKAKRQPIPADTFAPR